MNDTARLSYGSRPSALSRVVLDPAGVRSTISNCIVVVATLSCVFQLLWFGSKCFNEIDYDGMAYTGIARHLRQGEFHAAINAFRSPLMSWLIAAASFVRADYLHIGKLLNMGSLLLSIALLYFLTKRLWDSKLAASVAALLFALGRGLPAAAVGMVTPDFLFGALVMVYFILLIRCVRDGRTRDWFSLGAVHGLAFLAKAFALPWLALCTLAAVVLAGTPWQARASRLASAALIPVLVAGAWATVLHSKYRIFTTGSQFRTNFLQWTLREYREHRDSTYGLLTDTTETVDDPMPPGSWPWNYHINLRKALPKVIATEEHNVPRVLKEMMIVATPGGIIAFIATLAIVIRRRHQYPVEWRLSAVIAVSAISLVCAYSMLVFDGRYLYPLIPLVLAVAARFLIPDTDWDHKVWRIIAIALVVFGVIASIVYKSSPFRVVTRDFQVLCYDAGRRLRAHPGSTVVSIGSGPFPEHGVGWEAGYKAAYFGNRKLVAVLEDLPRPDSTAVVLADVAKATPDAVLVWGDSKNARYLSFVRLFALQYPTAVFEKISDPVLGNVGIAFFLDKIKPVSLTTARVIYGVPALLSIEPVNGSYSPTSHPPPDPRASWRWRSFVESSQPARAPVGSREKRRFAAIQGEASTGWQTSQMGKWYRFTHTKVRWSLQSRIPATT
jgi:Dolichyl-phosphate-mannose-protein mannosyltransferase